MPRPADVSWDYLSYWLATHGILSDVTEDVTDDYEFDPWRPAPNTEVVRVTLTLEDAAYLTAMVKSLSWVYQDKRDRALAELGDTGEDET